MNCNCLLFTKASIYKISFCLDIQSDYKGKIVQQQNIDIDGKC